MRTLLHVSSSLFGESGNAASLANYYIEQAKATDPSLQVIVRDLAVNPVAHLDAARMQAFMTTEAERTENQASIVAESDALIGEIQAADEIVIGLPMYNFGIPSQLKAWTDHLARAGVTFKYTDTGPVGLLADKPVTLIAARGGLYHEQGADFQVPYFKQMLGFVGLTQIETIYAEGLAMGDGVKESALSSAKAAIETRVAGI